MRFDFLIILLPAFLLLLSAEALVAQEVRYEQNTLIRIDSLSSGIVLKPGASSAPDFVSPIDGIPFSYEFETPEGLLRIKEMLSGCQECAPLQEDTGYTLEEIENVLRKLLAERGLPFDQTTAAGTDASAAAQSAMNRVDQLSRLNQFRSYTNVPANQGQPQDAADLEKREPVTNTDTDTPIAPAPSTPQAQRESLEEMIARVERDFTDKGSFTDQRVQFEFDSHKLLQGSFLLLNAIGTYMTNNPDQEIIITGNTCTIGPLEYNYRLSDLRANSVADYLLSNYPKIDAGQISTEGRGPDNPIANNDDPEVRYLNRRVEFIVKGEQ
ncbi:OmpA family protein [Rhodohalobacter sp. 8-1]|uniref:OmpA family protein n=1 Tax=Rhodohalobacter sp. 8-1 TaxID=3131972 RepID=UPI0030EC54DF